MIYTPMAASFVLELTDTKDHVACSSNQFKATLCVFHKTDRKQLTIGELTTQEKGKILFFLAFS